MIKLNKPLNLITHDRLMFYTRASFLHDFDHFNNKLLSIFLVSWVLLVNDKLFKTRKKNPDS